MSKRVTQDMVFLYAFGDLPESDRRLIEEAYRTDFQVRDWFARLGERPNKVAGEVGVHIALGDEVMQQAILRSLWIDPDELDSERGDMPPVALSPPPPVIAFLRVPESERQASPWATSLRLYDPRLHGGFDWHGSFPDLLAGATIKPQEYPLQQQTTEYLSQNGDQISLDCPEAIIPHGLGWLILTEPNGVVTLRLPELGFDRNAQRWDFECSVQALLSGRRPKDGELRIRFLPATEETRKAFEGIEVREFVESLPKRSTQRERALQFLANPE